VLQQKNVTFCIQLKQKESLQKTASKIFRQFFDPSNNLWVIAVFNVQIGPKCHNKDWVLGQKHVFDSV
jgi:hypothetical protein